MTPAQKGNSRFCKTKGIAMKNFLKTSIAALLMAVPSLASGQQYPDGIVDKTIAVVGNEMIMISNLEEEVRIMMAQGFVSDRDARCEILENMMVSKLFLMQARLDSLEVNNDMVESELANRLDQVRTYCGGDEGVEKQFGKPIYKLRQEWRKTFQDQSLTQQMQQNIMDDIPEITPYDVEEYIKNTDPEDLPVVPIKYQLSQICIYPDSVSQIVETPDGFHIIEVLEKKGDMFNARHILLRPEYTAQDKENAFRVLDSLKTEMANGAVSFDMAARFYSEDPATRTNGGQMADPNTGSSYYEIDQLKPQDYAAIKNLKEGEISEPVESLDNEGRDGNTVYKIIKVDKIIPAHTASFENDYNLLSEQVKQKTSMKAVDDFIDSKLNTTYIVIDPLFKNCDFDRDGWYAKFSTGE